VRLGGGEAHHPSIWGFEARDSMERCALSPSANGGNSSTAPSNNMNGPTVHFVVSNRYSRLDIFGFASSLWNDGSRG